MGNFISKTRVFIRETIEELYKCSWPSREELYETTIVVIVTIVLVSIFVGGIDFLSQQIITFLTAGF